MICRNIERKKKKRERKKLVCMDARTYLHVPSLRSRPRTQWRLIWASWQIAEKESPRNVDNQYSFILRDCNSCNKGRTKTEMYGHLIWPGVSLTLFFYSFSPFLVSLILILILALFFSVCLSWPYFYSLLSLRISRSVSLTRSYTFHCLPVCLAPISSFNFFFLSVWANADTVHQQGKISK